MAEKINPSKCYNSAALIFNTLSTYTFPSYNITLLTDCLLKLLADYGSYFLKKCFCSTLSPNN